jgi:hypothetical protein
MPNLILPSVHLNGTSRDELLRQIETAASAIADAVVALSAAAPNGRDYYVQGPDAMLAAQAQHENRLQRLQSVNAELHVVWEHLLDSASALRRA